MQVRHDFAQGDLVLGKTEGFPHWPARVQACLKNGAYNVVFFGEKSEAMLLPHMMLEYSPANVEQLKKGK